MNSVLLSAAVGSGLGGILVWYRYRLNGTLAVSGRKSDASMCKAREAMDELEATTHDAVVAHANRSILDDSSRVTSGVTESVAVVQ